MAPNEVEWISGVDWIAGIVGAFYHRSFAVGGRRVHLRCLGTRHDDIV